MNLVETFKSKRDGDDEHLYEWTIRSAIEHPNQVIDLLKFMLVDLKKGWTLFNDLHSYMPIDDFSGLIAFSIDLLRDNPNHINAQLTVEMASYQSLKNLHPHLDDLFKLKSNEGAHFSQYAWRESGLQHFNYLRKVIENSPDIEKKQEAWTRLFETRHPRAMNFARETAKMIEFDWSNYLRYVGYEFQEGVYKQLYADEVLHIVFPLEYRTAVSRPFHIEQTHHPTLTLEATDSQTYRFGGTQDGICASCGKGLHHLITLNPIPHNLDISNLNSLTLATCLSCLGWQDAGCGWGFFYEHGSDGYPKHIKCEIDHVAPEFPVEPFTEVNVQLVNAGQRWKWQDWGFTNSRENLHRVGGYPSWIQNADYTTCPQCKTTMSFILQLDSDIQGWWLWGSGGILYVCWCDSCKISGLFWQCT